MRARNDQGQEIELDKQETIDNMLHVLSIAVIKGDNLTGLLDYIKKIQDVNKGE
jgi:hypothetical protein